jgi:signal transduction histidine kinase
MKTPGAMARCSSLLVVLGWLALAAQAAAGADGLASPASSSSVVGIQRLQVDGQWRDLETNTAQAASVIRLSAGVHALAFHFAPTVETNDHCLRLRYKLEGLDKEWRETKWDGMRVTVRFQNAASEVVGESSFTVSGDSEGWRGAFTNSAFLPRHETLAVPDGAVRLAVLLVSGGPIQTVGVMAIDDLKLSLAPKARPGQEELLLRDDFEAGTHLERPEGTPTDWQRGGLRRDILQVARYGPGLTNHALAAVDTHIQSFGEWFRYVELQGRAKPGDVLVVEWKEMYSIGGGGPANVLYEVVPPGQYVFRLAGLASASGATVGGVELPLEVPVTFWHTAWFFGLCLGLSALVVAAGVRVLTQRRMQLQLERLEWQRSLERERARIARDIHDDLGAGLTRISMLSAATRERLKLTAAPPKELDEISGTSRELVRVLDEIVWVVNPKHDKLDSLVAYCGQYAQDFFKATPIRCRLDLAFDVPDWTLTSQMRHNLFLAFKEALNNAACHAQAQTVEISAQMEAAGFALAVKDDGQGFECHQSGGAGNGLTNMQHRLAELGGCCLIQSAPGAGTTVKFIIKV